MALGTTCKCNVCGRKFLYGDCQSPMLKDSIWGKIVHYYCLTDYETKAAHRFSANYRRNRKHYDNEHLYICYVCMEKALHRKLRRNDLIGTNVPLNAEFEEMYFSK